MDPVEEQWGFAHKRPGEAEIDWLGTGALGIRLSSEDQLLQHARNLAMYGATGAEFNPLANAALAFKLRVTFCTALVELSKTQLHPLAEWILRTSSAMGVNLVTERFRDNGRGDPSHAIVFSDAPVGRRPNVYYYRATEAGRLLAPGMFPWNELMAKTRWASSGGLFAALSPSTTGLIVEMAESAAAHGVPFSFDINWRGKLVKDIEEFRQAYDRILSCATFVFGNESDISDATGIEVTAGHEAVVRALVKRYPNIKAVGTSLRKTPMPNIHTFSGLLYIARTDTVHRAPKKAFNVRDRVGGGDAFHSGIVSACLMGLDPYTALLYGWAMGALKLGCPGDLCLAPAAEIIEMAESKGDPEKNRIKR